jgi:hypothetical protein
VGVRWCVPHVGRRGGGGPAARVWGRRADIRKQGRACGGKAPACGLQWLGGWWVARPAILGPARCTVTFFYLIQNVQTDLILIRSKDGLPMLKFFHIK